MIIMRTLTHALIIFGAMNVFSLLVGQASKSAVQALFALIGTGAFLPFSIASAAGLHNQRPVAITALLLTLLLAWPFTLQQLPIFIVPVAAGLFVGAGL